MIIAQPVTPCSLIAIVRSVRFVRKIVSSDFVDDATTMTSAEGVTPTSKIRCAMRRASTVAMSKASVAPGLACRVKSGGSSSSRVRPVVRTSVSVSGVCPSAAP